MGCPHPPGAPSHSTCHTASIVRRGSTNRRYRLRERSYRQLFIKDLGHDEPTILITNDAKSSARNLITRYAKRMLIENALADAVRFFHIDALSSSVGFKVDFDMALLVLASALYRLTARRMRGYDDAQARQIFRDLVDMPADVAVTPAEVRVRFHRRAHLPIVLASGLIDKPVTVPWWQGVRVAEHMAVGILSQEGEDAGLPATSLRQIAHSGDRDHLFRRIAIRHSDRSRAVWRGA